MKLSKLFLPQMDRLIRDYLLLIFILAISGLCLYSISGLHIREGLKTAGVVGLASAFCTLLHWRYHKRAARFAEALLFLDRHALPILLAWQVAYLTWCGLVLFANPYRYEVAQGDAAWYVQTLWNLVDGFRPENSVFTLNGVFTPGDDPRYPNAIGYVSIFSMHQYWLPMAMLAPIYAIFPQPPMHVFALQICVIAFGLPGMYWATRHAGASRRFALLAAIGYSLLPQVGTQLFFKGMMDVMGFGILPWLFGALLARKWMLTYLFALLTALISFPFTHFVIISGLAILLFCRAIAPGVIVTVIGLSILTMDMAVMTTALGSYYAFGKSVPSFFETFVLEHSIELLIANAKFNFVYVIFLLQGVAFLPVIAIWRTGRLNNAILGIWFILGLAFIAMIWRSFGWEFQRNAFFVVPAYMLGIASCISLQRQMDAAQKRVSENFLDVPAVLLFFGMTTTILFGNPFSKGPLATHFPWGPEVSVVSSEESISWRDTMTRFNELIPQNASIAWRASPKIHAFLANRQHSWVVGRQPAGVKYSVFIGDAELDGDGVQGQAAWKSQLAKLRGDAHYKVLYDANPGKPLLIFENLHAHAIARNEELLGWSVVLQPIARFWCNPKDWSPF